MRVLAFLVCFCCDGVRLFVMRRGYAVRPPPHGRSNRNATIGRNDTLGDDHHRWMAATFDIVWPEIIS